MQSMQCSIIRHLSKYSLGLDSDFSFIRSPGAAYTLEENPPELGSKSTTAGLINVVLDSVCSVMDSVDRHPSNEKITASGECSRAVGNSSRGCWTVQMTLKTSLAMLVVLAAAAARAVPVTGARPDVGKDSGFCSEIIEPYILYNCTEYTVTTFDGFLLTLQHIQLIDFSGNFSRGDVLFLHPSVLGGSSWFLATTPTPLAIADAGYSVWIGNMRTTEFSFGHNQLSPTQQEFWNWDMDELANYDFPSFVDFVYSATNGRKFHFVGYSQGARVGLGTISYQWNRAAMLASVTLLAPVVYMTNTLSRVLIALNYTDMAELGYHLGLGKMNFSALVGVTSPTDSQELHDLEAEFLCQITGPNCCVDQHVAYAALSGPYSSTTFKNLAHITQSMRSTTFMAYDYGSLNANNEVYQSQVPPKYKLAQVPSTVPIFVLYGGNDRLSTADDINYLISQLSAQPQVLFNPLYAHLDYLLSNAMMQDVNLPLLSFIGQHDNGQ